MTEPTYWLPEWWDYPAPGYKWQRIINQSHGEAPGAVLIQQAVPDPPQVELPHGGGPPGPPPAAAAAVQVTDEELHAIKRQRRHSREKRLRR